MADVAALGRGEETAGSAWLRRIRPAGYLYAAPTAAFLLVAPEALDGTRMQPLSSAQWWYLALLLALVPLARRFPVRLSSHFLIVLQTPALLLLALLLPLPYAALGALVACLAGEILMRRRNGLIVRDWRRGMDLRDLASIGATASLSTLVAGIGVAAMRGHGFPIGVEQTLGLALGGAGFLVSDLFWSALLATRREDGNPLRLFVTFARHSTLHETAQVGLAGVGLLLADLHPAALLLAPALAVPIYAYLKHDLHLQISTRAMLIAMADAVDRRDRTTYEHSQRVAAYVAEMARIMHIGAAEADLIITAARVHDIGKVSIPDGVLFKPSPLTDEERRVMQSHATLGADLLSGYRNFQRGVGIVRHHHECWDGSGYPGGLRGIRIPQGARMIAVADSYDAMVSDRPYRAGLPHAAAIAELQRGRDVQWEGYLVGIFLEALQSISERPLPMAGAARAVEAPTVPLSVAGMPQVAHG